MNEKQTIEFKGPELPCDECLRDETCTASDGSFVFTYCAHRCVGGVLDLRDNEAKNIWRIYTPINAEQFSSVIDATLSEAEGKESA